MSDRIEKQIVLRAPIARVWHALSDAKEFGAWFGVNLPAGELTPGAWLRGTIAHEGYELVMFEALVERVEAPHLLALRWHPNAIDPDFDYESEPTTLVTFRLEEAGSDTRLTVTESGFDGISASRRAQALRDNEGGWEEQMRNIERHVAAPV
jgi:uncharacterized protein YndB with AHSA1/START domain